MRKEIADAIMRVTPVLPNFGPPLPRYFKIRWPEAVWSKEAIIAPLSKVSKVYGDALNKLTSTIKGF